MKRLIAIVCMDLVWKFELNYYYDVNGKVKKEKVTVNKKKPIVNSLTKEYPVADFYEREIKEFFGIKFKGGSDERLFLPEDGSVKKPLIRGGKRSA